ncbi:MAG: putative toxin-antitoxin system toxin component, PIN family [Gammaproteobacteria bacterium]
MRVVIDTNLWVSYLIRPNSPLIPVLDNVAGQHTLLYSSATLAELAEVLVRPKFAYYIGEETVRAFLAEFIATGEEIMGTALSNELMGWLATIRIFRLGTMYPVYPLTGNRRPAVIFPKHGKVKFPTPAGHPYPA